MFGKNKAFAAQTTTRLVRTTVEPGDESIAESSGMSGPEVAAAYSEVAKDFITHAAVVVTAAFSICQIVKRICR